MRLGTLFALLAGLAAPALAADTLAEQAHDAFATFAGGLSQDGFVILQYGRVVFSGIDGKWARLSGPDPKSGSESYGPDTERICKAGGAQTIHSPDPVTLNVTTSLPAGSYTEKYTLVAGATFGNSTDPTQYLTAIGLLPRNNAPGLDQPRALALSLVNGLFQIYRPSEDILVLTRDRGYPLIYARCPAS